MAVSVKDLRYKTRQVLKSLLRGERPVITLRGRAVARIVPITQSEQRVFRDVGFGMWKERREMRDPSKWVDEQRRPRFGR